jgi:hypothetical protein
MLAGVCLLLVSRSSTALAAAFTPQQPLSFNFFTGANESWFEYPEIAGSGNYTISSLLNRPKLGIALSGGGFRYLIDCNCSLLNSFRLT